MRDEKFSGVLQQKFIKTIKCKEKQFFAGFDV